MTAPLQTTIQENRGVGVYSTPSKLARFLVDWAVRSPADKILDPCTGDGVFLEHVADRLHFLGLKNGLPEHLLGVEIDQTRAVNTSRRLQSIYGIPPTIIPEGFFKTLRELEEGSYDVVIGNPPFVRYRKFLPENERVLAFEFLEKHGFRASRMTNAWVPFVVAGMHLLRDKGRLAMIVPAELLQVSYAAPIREYLHNKFGFIYVVTFNRLVFPDVEQEVVLLLGTKGEGRGLHLVDCRDESDPQLVRKFQVPQEPVQNSTGKWTQYFLNDEQRASLRSALAHEQITRLGNLASVDVGVVTGQNSFFVLNVESVENLHIESRYLKPVVARTASMRGSIFARSDWKAADPKQLLALDSSHALSRSVSRYVREGVKKGVHRNYKCRIRDKWYSVPSVWPPDAFMFRQIGRFPRIVLNNSPSTCTDTIHRVRFKNGSNPSRVVAGFYNSLTFAFAEMYGRSYGGGVLEIMPTEAEMLPIPRMTDEKFIHEIDELVRKDPLMAVDLGDKRILDEELKMSQKTISIIRSAWLSLSERRKSRRAWS